MEAFLEHFSRVAETGIHHLEIKDGRVPAVPPSKAYQQIKSKNHFSNWKELKTKINIY